jgi:hypothetical protein
VTTDVRRIRDEHAKTYGYNLHAICDAIRVKEAQGSRTLITLQPKLPRANQKAV